jgi:phasin family protein
MAAKAKKSETPRLSAVPPAPFTPPFAALGAGFDPTSTPFATLSYAEFAAIGRDNIEAAARTNAALSAGVEAIGREMMECARALLQRTSETARGLLGAKTLEDVVKLQTDLAQRSFEGMVSGSARLSELGYALATEAVAPWEGRYEAAIAQWNPAPAGETKSAA